MKNKLFAITVLLTVFISFRMISQKKGIIDLSLSNIEALANYEGDSDKYIKIETYDVSHTDYGRYVEICTKTNVNCMPGGYEDCTPDSWVYCYKIGKG